MAEVYVSKSDPEITPEVTRLLSDFIRIDRKDGVNTNSRLEELGVGSLSLHRLIGRLEGHFGVRIESPFQLRLNTIGDLVGMVRANMTEQLSS